MDALLDSSIEFITAHHEQGAAFMAAMEGRLTGKPGVCLSTLGPGATNLITGVASANMDRCPLVAITSQAGEERLHKESHQVYNLTDIYKPMTKWNTSIRRPEVIPEVIRKAFRIAADEKPGAAHIALPEDIAGLEMEDAFSPIKAPPKEEVVASKQQINHAAKIINDAKNPLIMVGNGVIRKKAEAKLHRFADKIKAPAVSTLMGKGALDERAEFFLNTVGVQASDRELSGFDYTDLIICIGFDMVEYPPERWNPGGNIPILHIDTKTAETDACYPVISSLTGDIDHNLHRLTKSIESRKKLDRHYRDLLERSKQETAKAQNDDSFPIKPQRLIAELRSALEEKDLVISDVGAHKMWISKLYPTYKSNTCLITNGFASMGVALPGAIAAKRVYPERKVVAVIGDGAFQMSLQELETAVRLQLPIMIVIWRDARYGLIESKQLRQFDRSSHIKFKNPDYVKLAEAYGAKGLRVHSADELKEILQQPMDANVPVIIDCEVDYEENKKLMQ
jgi:acetolactate synthase-1/2/3 large subunit